jgi:glycosyltransferase involved in cell wall biosynthesis
MAKRVWRSGFTTVAIVAPLPPPIGGMSLQGQALRENLQREQIDVVVIATNPPLPPSLARLRGVRTLLQTLLYLSSLARNLPGVGVVHILAASYFFFFARVLPAVVIGRLLGVRVVLNYRGGEAPQFIAKFGLLVRPVLRFASIIVVPSAYLERCFLEHGIACAIVPNLIDLDRFKFRQRKHLQPTFLVSRNLEPMYNIQMALRAFELVKRRHSDAVIHVIGTGSEEKPLKSWAESRHLKDVFFHGAVPNEGMPEHYLKADILLNSSYIDNLPINLLEAFASGVPVISTNVGGIPDLVGDEKAALLVEANDHQAMAQKIESLLNNPGLVVELTVSARQLAGSYTWHHVRKKLLKTYFPEIPLSPSTTESEIVR